MIRYVKKSSRFTATLYKTISGDDAVFQLLWGDRVRVLDDTTPRCKVKARGLTGYIEPSKLTSTSLLEFYFIDVGQGDGVFIRTPNGKHILIDGGWPRRSQPTGKNAADFVDWKFHHDYESDTIKLDAMICSHNDQDHYGGLWDLLDKDQHEELDTKHVHVENFYHAGLSWWKDAAGNRTLGPSVDTNEGEMWTQLLEGRASLEQGLTGAGGHPKLQGEWAKFLGKVIDARTSDDSPTPVSRLGSNIDSLSEFDRTNFKIHVVAPVDFEVAGQNAIRKYVHPDARRTPSQNTNGNSVLLRVDYKNSRTLLTGDLNLRSQQFLLKDYRGNEGVFASDVAKACHHGSDDVSYEFLESIEPACTVISSGDSEGHDHPRPEIIAVCGVTGRKLVQGDQLVTPLVYSTELARSIALGKITKVEEMRGFTGTSVAETYDADELKKLKAHFEVVDAGARNPKRGTCRLSHQRLATTTTYGLINVRTDGNTIMCAALNEKDLKWNVTSFKSRFDGVGE